MKTIADYIEQLKKTYKINSYYKAMEFLEMDRQAWTKIQKGGGISEKNAIRLANALKISPIEIMAVSNALKAPNNEIRDIWLKLAKEKEEERTENQEYCPAEETSHPQK